MIKSIDLLGQDYLFKFKNQSFILDAAKVVYWADHRILIVSDVHLGKAGHFRKNGIPVPSLVHRDDFQRINSLIEKYKPVKILFLGDLFHSEPNEEWNDLVYWSNHHRGIEQLLVEGNHDRLTRNLYSQTAMILLESFTLDNLEFTHETRKSTNYNIAGHIHPSFKLPILARQSQNLPCFQFGSTNALVPAFGQFTGTHPIKPSKGDLIFAIEESQLMRITV